MANSSYQNHAAKMADKYGLPRDVFFGLIRTESGWSHTKSDGTILRGTAGELGLGQLKPSTAAELGVDPLDPYQNIEGSARYLSQQYHRFDGDITKALAAYNQGAVGSQTGVGISRGLDYARRVLSAESGFTGQLDTGAKTSGSVPPFDITGRLAEGVKTAAPNIAMVLLGVVLVGGAIFLTVKGQAMNLVVGEAKKQLQL